MANLQPPSRLSQISTNWTELLAAADGPEDASTEAQRMLLQRYANAVYRYLLGAVRDPHVADDLAQEFAVRFLRGGFQNADPSRGRFRDFLKRALSNLVTDYYRRQRSAAESLSHEASDSNSLEGIADDFDESWRTEILNRTWKALGDAQSGSKTDYFSVLRIRAEHPELSSSELANKLSEVLGKSVTPAWVRQTLKRARQKFNELMRDEVSKTLGGGNDDQVDDELAALGLLKYCRS